MKYVYRSSLKYPFFFSDFNETWIFPTNFGKYSNESPSGGAEFFNADVWRDGQTNKQK